MYLFCIETRNGKFISIGETEHQAKINFTMAYPNEKIRKIRQLEGKAISVGDLLE